LKSILVHTLEPRQLGLSLILIRDQGCYAEPQNDAYEAPRGCKAIKGRVPAGGTLVFGVAGLANCGNGEVQMYVENYPRIQHTNRVIRHTIELVVSCVHLMLKYTHGRYPSAPNSQ